jgi:hypothetical protein
MFLLVTQSYPQARQMRCRHNIRKLQNCLFHQPLLLFSHHLSVISSTRVPPSDYVTSCSPVSSVSSCISKWTLSQLQNFSQERPPRKTGRDSCGCHGNRDVTHPLTPRVLHNKADISSEGKACISMDAWCICVMRHGRGVEHPHPSSAEVKKEYGYTSTPSGPSGLLRGTFTFNTVDSR